MAIFSKEHRGIILESAVSKEKPVLVPAEARRRNSSFFGYGNLRILECSLLPLFVCVGGAQRKSCCSGVAGRSGRVEECIKTAWSRSGVDQIMQREEWRSWGKGWGRGTISTPECGTDAILAGA